MDVLLFLFFSALEWYALIILSFTLFKFEIRWYRGQILLSSFLLSLFSYIWYEVLDLTAWGTIIQPPIVFIFFWQIFRIAPFYAGLMVINGYLGYCVISLFIYTIYRLMGATIFPGTPLNYTAQFASALLSLLISWLIFKYRLGVTFVPHGERATVKLKGINLRLFLFTLVGYAAVSGTTYLYLFGNYNLLVIVLISGAFGLLQYSVFRKEYSDDD